MIAWARTRAGLSEQEAAQKFTKIAAWEAGSALPTYPQLEKLADEFKLPVAVFFFPDPPNVPPIRESFRTLPDAEFDQIPRQVGALLRKAKALQLNLSELTGGQNPAPRLITRDLDFLDDISTTAAHVRDYLGITLDQQFAWADDDTALKAWRDALHKAGIFVFKDAFRVEGYSGFSLYDDVFPIIYVNNSSSKTRQIFTLFHELAHLLFHTSGVDTVEDRYIPNLPEQQKRIEILCNRFAAAFLVPEAAFRHEFAKAGRDPSERTAEVLAARFNVSRETIYRKLLDERLITQSAYEKAARLWAAQKQPGSGGDYYRTQIAYLGRDYIELALREFYQNRIDDEQLGAYLNVKPRNVGVLEEYFAKSGQ
jgi:Zn-dependent peptidase ImmA (M78 family)